MRAAQPIHSRKKIEYNNKRVANFSATLLNPRFSAMSSFNSYHFHFFCCRAGLEPAFLSTSSSEPPSPYKSVLSHWTIRQNNIKNNRNIFSSFFFLSFFSLFFLIAKLRLFSLHYCFSVFYLIFSLFFHLQKYPLYSVFFAIFGAKNYKSTPFTANSKTPKCNTIVIPL